MTAVRRGGKPLPRDWPAIRRRILKRDPLCGCGRLATEVDHIEPSGSDADSNLKGMCSPCHASKSGREGARARAKRLELRKRLKALKLLPAAMGLTERAEIGKLDLWAACLPDHVATPVCRDADSKGFLD